MAALTGWQLAVYEALHDLSGPGCPCVSRHDLLQYRLISLMERVGSRSRAPGQDVSLALQRLRDKGLVDFVGVGTYRLREPGTRTAAGASRRPLDIETEVTMTEQIVGHRVTVGEEGVLVARDRVVSPPRERDVPRAHGAAPSGPPKRVYNAEPLRALQRERAARKEQAFQEALQQARAEAGHAKDVLTLKFVPLCLVVPGDMNRHVDEERCRKMATTFRWRSVVALGVEALPPDPAGVVRYMVREGHHRRRTLCLLYGEDSWEPVPIVEMAPEARAGMARTVLDINNNHTRWTVTATQRLAVQADEPTAVAVAKILGRYGLKAQEEGGSASRLKPGEVSGIVALREMIDLAGEPLVDLTVAALYRGYGTNPTAFRAPVLRGAADFLLRYWDAPDFRADVLDRCFQGTDPLDLLERAREIRRAARGKKSEPGAVAEAIFEAYAVVKRKPAGVGPLPGFTTESTLRAATVAMQERAGRFRAEHEAGRLVSPPAAAVAEEVEG